MLLLKNPSFKHLILSYINETYIFLSVSSVGHSHWREWLHMVKGSNLTRWKMQSWNPEYRETSVKLLKSSMPHGLIAANFIQETRASMDYEWKPTRHKLSSVLFSSSLFLSFPPLVRTKNGGRYIDAGIDCSLASRYTDIQLIIFSSYREVSPRDKSVNRWTPAKRDGTDQTIRFPPMKFFRTKANTLLFFFPSELDNFNFELASQRVRPVRACPCQRMQRDDKINYNNAGA